MVVVLFTMLVQSLHTLGHLHELFSEKECHHKYSGKTEVSHQHHPFDKCFVCEFTLAGYTFSEFQAFQTIAENNFTTSFPAHPEDVYLIFDGSQIALRGPPAV